MINDADYCVLKELMNEIARKIEGFVSFRFELDIHSEDKDFPIPVFNIYVNGNDIKCNENFDNVIDLIKWMNKLIIRLNRKPKGIMQAQNAIAESENNPKEI